ncbi:unnamed protein product [Caenorhabditis brenneri]
MMGFVEHLSSPTIDSLSTLWMRPLTQTRTSSISKPSLTAADFIVETIEYSPIRLLSKRCFQNTIPSPLCNLPSSSAAPSIPAKDIPAPPLRRNAKPTGFRIVEKVIESDGF